MDLARKTRGAQSAFGYTPTEQPEDRLADAERQRRTQPFFHHVEAVAPVAAEILVAAVAGQRDRDVLARQLADAVGRNRGAVGIRFVVQRRETVHEVEVVACDVIDEMTGAVPVRDLLREAGLVERRIVERDRAGVHGFALETRAIVATTALESTPPDRKAPSGTSEIIRSRTDSSSR